MRKAKKMSEDVLEVDGLKISSICGLLGMHLRPGQKYRFVNCLFEKDLKIDVDAASASNIRFEFISC